MESTWRRGGEKRPTTSEISIAPLFQYRSVREWSARKGTCTYQWVTRSSLKRFAIPQTVDMLFVLCSAIPYDLTDSCRPYLRLCPSIHLLRLGQAIRYLHPSRRCRQAIATKAVLRRAKWSVLRIQSVRYRQRQGFGEDRAGEDRWKRGRRCAEGVDG